MPLHRHLRDRLYLPISLWATYAVTYFLAGTLMNQVGQWLEIARFTYWWQVITVYVLYMVPLSVIFRRLPWWQQYLYGLFPMGLLEFGGYALHTSYAYPHNLDRPAVQRAQLQPGDGPLLRRLLPPAQRPGERNPWQAVPAAGSGRRKLRPCPRVAKVSGVRQSDPRRPLLGF